MKSSDIDIDKLIPHAILEKAQMPGVAQSDVKRLAPHIFGVECASAEYLISNGFLGGLRMQILPQHEPARTVKLVSVFLKANRGQRTKESLTAALHCLQKLSDFQDALYGVVLSKKADGSLGAQLLKPEEATQQELEKAVKYIAAQEYAGRISHFDVSHSQVTDLSVLSQLVSIKHVDAQFCKELSDLAAFCSANPDLFTVDLRGCIGVVNIKPLFSLPYLQILTLSESGVSSLEGIPANESLTELRLSDTAICDISSLQGLPLLTKLTLRNTAVEDIGVLKEIGRLNLIDLRQCTNIKDFSPLLQIPDLKTLVLSFNNRVNREILEALEEKGVSIKVMN